MEVAPTDSLFFCFVVSYAPNSLKLFRKARRLNQATVSTFQHQLKKSFRAICHVGSRAEWLHGVPRSVMWMGRSHAPPPLQLINSNQSQHGASVETDSHCVEAPLARPRRCLRASQDPGSESAVPEGFVAGDYRLAAECSLCNHRRSKSKGQAGELRHRVDI